MATKFMKNPSLSSPTTSSPVKLPNPLATNLRAQNLPALASTSNNFNVFGTRTAGPRGVKRGRDSSGGENSSDEDATVRGDSRAGIAGHVNRRKIKRARRGEHQWTVYHSKLTRREASSDEDSDDEEDMTPSPVKRTGLNIGGLSLTPPGPVSSEYASMNGLLRMLHLNRGLRDSRSEMSNGSGKELEGSKLQPLRAAVAHTSQNKNPARGQPDDRNGVGEEVNEQREKDSVTSIYEEANRALGRLMLDRRKAACGAVMFDAEQDEEDSDDYEDG